MIARTFKGFIILAFFVLVLEQYSYYKLKEIDQSSLGSFKLIGQSDSTFEPDPIMGRRQRANLRDIQQVILNTNHWIVRQSTFHSDDFGRRTYSKVLKPRGQNKNTIIFLGDSFTAGYGLNYEYSFPAIIENTLKSWQVLNYGVPGFGISEISLQVNKLKNQNIDSSSVKFGIYTYLPQHYLRMSRRLNGSANIPVTEVEDGRVVSRGIYDVLYPWRNKIYNLLTESSILRILKIYKFPPWISSFELQNYCMHLKAMKDEFTTAFPTSKFILILHGTPEEKLDGNTIECARNNNITFYEYPLRGDTNLLIPYDGHPNEENNLKFANWFLSLEPFAEIAATPNIKQ